MTRSQLSRLPRSESTGGGQSTMMHRVNLISIFVIALLFQWTNSSDFFNQHFKSNLSKDDEYYKILGISKTATDRDVKAAYRKKAMQIHPDKGGNEEDFKRLVEAYEVLSDQNKRKLYDTFGKVGIKGQHNPDFASASSMNPDFRDFFRSFSNFPVVYNIEIDLEDFFRGRSLSVVIQNEKFSIDIEPGMYDGTEIRGQIIDRSGTTRQIVLILQEKSHPYFRRKNGDLYMECTISLAEVMLGFERVITHLDGSQFTIRSKEGDLVAPDEVLMIEGLGMPLYRSDTRAAKGKVLERGRLFVKVKVDIPSRLSFTAEERQLLQKIFSSKQGQRVPKNPSSVDPPRKIPPIPVFTPQKSDLRKFGGVGSFYDEENADNDFNGFSSFFFR